MIERVDYYSDDEYQQALQNQQEQEEEWRELEEAKQKEAESLSAVEPQVSMQPSLFSFDDTNDWRAEWKDMPEYNNTKKPEPFITVTFKFRCQKDFDEFNRLLKKYVYNGEKVFDGMQRKNIKSTWYPLQEKASKYCYINEA